MDERFRYLLPYMTAYKSHKIVNAAFIRRATLIGAETVRLYIDGNDGSVGSVEVDVPKDILLRVPNGIQGMAPGYIVLYENDYLSWSPVDVFDNGYIKLSDVKKPKLYLHADALGVVLSAYDVDQDRLFEANHVELIDARTARRSAEHQMPADIFKQVLANVFRQAGIEVQVE